MIFFIDTVRMKRVIHTYQKFLTLLIVKSIAMYLSICLDKYFNVSKEDTYLEVLFF